MRLKEIEKQQFKELFEKAPCVLEIDYQEIAFAFWICTIPVIGVKIIYRFSHNEIKKQYFFIDFSEIYEGKIRNFALAYFNTDTERLEIEKFIVRQFDFAVQTWLELTKEDNVEEVIEKKNKQQ
jgi:hypothetical protein